MNLKYLHLLHAEVGDAGLEHIKGLTQLARLCLQDTDITDAGLEHVKGLKHLRSLDITGTKGNPRGRSEA